MTHPISMTSSASRPLISRSGRLGACTTLILAVLAAGAAQAQTRLPSVDRFTATTDSMTPSGIELRIDVREWSDEASRAEVVAALQEPDPSDALEQLPTLGYVWRSNSGVGSAVKYAHRVATPEGDRITFVTDRRIDATEFRPWTVDSASPGAELAYSVIELYLNEDGTGSGNLSLASKVQLAPDDASVSLAADAGGLHVLANAKEEPKPYWAAGRDAGS